MRQRHLTGFAYISYRGANLRDTSFPPYDAPIEGTDLRGADIRGARDVYGIPLGGMIDEHTQYDEEYCHVGEESPESRAILCEVPPPQPAVNH